MNPKLVILTLAVATLIAVPAAVVAQQGPGDCDGSGPHGPGGPGALGGPGGPDGPGVLGLVQRFADRLDLSEAQQGQISTIVEASRPSLDALRDQAAAARETFHDSYGIGDFDAAAYRAFFESQAQLHVQMQLIGAETVAQVWAVLTPAQQQELLDLMELVRDGRGGPRFGGGKRYGGLN